MDKIEEILPRIASFLKDDLSKEPLSSKAEKKRLYYVTRIEQAQQDAGLQDIITKYEPVSCELGVERRTTVLRGNVVPTPFNRSSIAEQKTTTQTNQVTVAYEVLPCDLTYEEVCPKEVYSEMTIHGTALPSSSSSSSIVTNGGSKHPILHPPHPPPLPPTNSSRPPSPPPPVYDEAFQSNRERIPEASESDSDTDYEEYAETEEKEDDSSKRNTGSQPVRHNSSKLKTKGRQQTVDISGSRYRGVLHQKGTFQFQRRFCALCGTRFLCCKSESSLKVVLELDVREYEIVLQEPKEGKTTTAYPFELRFSCPGKETFLFYTESRQKAEEWVKALRLASTLKQNSVESDTVSLIDETDRQSDKTSFTVDNNPKTHTLDDVKKKSKLQNLLGTVGKKLGNKTKNLFQSVELSQTKATETEQEFGYVSIRSEEFTGDRWFKRFCRVESGHLNCYADQWSTDVRPEFSLDLRGAQLKPLEERNELKINLVKDGKEHCIKMSDFMHHGRWLMTLIKETGYANHLLSKNLNNKDVYADPVLYEELASFIVLDGATVDDTNADEDDPPPLPTASPPSSPIPEGGSSMGLQRKQPDPEGIYLEPTEWIQDVNKLKRNKRRKPINAAPLHEEESAYINRDFARTALNSRETSKDSRVDKGSINSSSSYPNLTSLGISNDPREGPSDHGENPGPKAGGKFRPSSAMVESLENLADMTDRKNCRGPGVTKGSSLPADRTAGFLAQPPRRQEEQFADAQKKSEDRARNKIVWDELLKGSKTRTSGSDSSDDLNNKKMVQNLVQMFEKKV